MVRDLPPNATRTTPPTTLSMVATRLSDFSLALVLCLVPSVAVAADWPMSGHDAGRTGVSPQELPPSLQLQWVREYPPLVPAWPDQDKMQFDCAYDPVIVGHTLY